MTPEEIATQIIGWYEKYGQRDYIGEGVSQLSHMTQAGELARQETEDPELELAAFLHDLEHLRAFESSEPVDQMGGYGVRDHEHRGAQFLREHGFSERVARLVQEHVSAKRYLCSTDEKYYESLSSASQYTFHEQGGYLSPEEITQYEANPEYLNFCQMRRWDDRAKEDLPLKELPSLEHYRALILAHLTREK